MIKRNERLASVSLAVCAGITAVAGLATGVVVPAGAAGGRAVSASLVPAVASGPTEAKFLTAAQLPQGPRYRSWKAMPARAGLPDPRTFCLGGTMSPTTTSYTAYRSGTEAGAQHFIAVGATDARATALAAKLKAKIQGCFQEWLELTGHSIYQGKRITASWKRYGTYDVADGLTVWGVFTSPPKPTPPTTHLYAVGRDGRTVTVLHLGLNGVQKDAPAGPFTETAETAMREMY